MSFGVMDPVDVIVIGAGISGLYSAYQLQKKQPELKILVLEAKGTLMDLFLFLWKLNL